jgi:hypothetical protein
MAGRPYYRVGQGGYKVNDNSRQKHMIRIASDGFEDYEKIIPSAFSQKGLPCILYPLSQFNYYKDIDLDYNPEESYGYILEDAQVRLYANTSKAIMYFLRDISLNEMPKSRYVCPKFKIRGVVEGFYGNPWTKEQRLQLMPRLAYEKFNTFIYGPKDDNYTCHNWRLPYPKEELDYLYRLVQVCDDNFIDFYYLLAPCFTIEYSNPDDFSAIVKKFKQLYGIGVTNFGILFDDIVEKFQYPSDEATYSSLVEAHIDLANRVYRLVKQLNKNNKLIVCPTEYWGDGSKGYLSSLSKEIPKDCFIFYTGPTICSYELTVENAINFMKIAGKKPLYWDNYPVNDANMTNEFHIGPITGRDAKLYQFSEGLVANPMEYMESSMISLCTIGDYLCDPENYDPVTSHRNVLGRILGERYINAGEEFHKLCYKSCLTKHGEQFLAEDPEKTYHEEFSQLIRKLDFAGMKSFAYRTIDNLNLLSQSDNRQFLDESKRWRDCAMRFCQTLLKSIALINEDKAKAVCILNQYLSEHEDIMKYEVKKLIETLRR